MKKSIYKIFLSQMVAGGSRAVRGHLLPFHHHLPWCALADLYHVNTI